MATRVPERLRWAVEVLAVDPADRVLEIGCGHGVAVELIAGRLRGGKVTAIDRSGKMTAAAAARNATHIASGRAELHTVALAEAAFPEGEFDKVFAVNVNLFWVGSPGPELALLRRLLAPGGALYLFYEPPSPARAGELAAVLPGVLSAHGFAPEVRRAAPALICIFARPR